MTAARNVLAAQSRAALRGTAEASALDGALARRARNSAQSGAADRNGRAFERATYATLDDMVAGGVLAAWAHHGPAVEMTGPRTAVVVGKAPVDIVGYTREGYVYRAEVKHHTDRVYVRAEPASGSRAARVKEHQRAELDAVDATAHGFAELIVCVRGVCAIIPWREVSQRAWLTVTDVRAYLATLDADDAQAVWSKRLQRAAEREGL